MSSKTIASAEAAVPERIKFEKVLWRKQPFPDNHVPATFLSDLRTNSQIVLPSLRELMVASLRVSARFLSVVLFALLFVHLHLGTLDSELLLLAVLGISLLITALSSLFQPGEDAEEGRGGGRRKAVSGALGKVIMGLVLLAVSPVLRTLTESTTSDSIWALAAVLFFLHLALADYLSSEGRGEGGKKLSDTLSFNAAISASVVLASRLNSNTDTFTLLTLAILLFAPTTSTVPRLGAGGRFALLYLATMATAAAFVVIRAEEQRERGWIVVVLTWSNLVVAFVSVVCPYWMKHAQEWKMEIAGPWDPAEPVLCSSHAHI